MANLFYRFISTLVIIASFLSALMCTTQSHGAADSTDTAQLSVHTGMLWDDNLFRLPNANAAASGAVPQKRSDRIARIGVGIQLDKTISRQRLLASLALEQNSYDRHDVLDHIAGNAGAKWLWAAGNQWSGELGYDRRRRLSQFSDLSVNNVAVIVKNLVDEDKFTFTGGYRPHPRWRVWGGADFLESSNSSPTLIQNDTRITTGSLGVDYLTPLDNTIGLLLTHGEGQFPNRQVIASRLIDNQYSETSSSLRWGWRITGHSSFEGRLGYTVREHEQFSARDFSGTTFRLNYTWLPTGKLRVAAAAWRELSTAETDTSSYVLASGVRLIPQWALTPKFTLRSVLSYETRAYEGDPGVVLGGTAVREDDVRVIQVAAVYSPSRNTQLLLSLERGSRTSNQQQFQFDYSSALVNLKVDF